MASATSVITIVLVLLIFTYLSEPVLARKRAVEDAVLMKWTSPALPLRITGTLFSVVNERIIVYLSACFQLPMGQ